METPVDAKPLSIRRIFEVEECLLVPVFQRPYVWNMEKNWEPLWNDILNALETFHEADAVPHFMGAVVLDHMRTSREQMPSRLVVDGQQRLTTMQIVLSAVRDAFRILEVDQRLVNALRQLTQNQDELYTDKYARFKVWPTLTDRAALADIVLAGGPADIDALLTRDGGESRLVDAYRFFHARALDWLNEHETNTRDERARALVDVLRDGLQLVVINLDEHDNAQVIFESLNDRGTELQPSDLIKNLVFQIAESNEDDPEELNELYWSNFETAAWRTPVRQGRLNRSRLDAFFSHYLTMRTGREVLAPVLFTRFRTYLLDTVGTDLEDFLADLESLSRVYQRIQDCDGETAAETTFFQRLKVLDTSVVLPVVMHLTAHCDGDTRVAAFQDIESWLMRRLVCRLTSKNYNRMMLDLLKELQDAEDPAAIVKTYLSRQTAESAYWPNDDDVHMVLLTQPIYKQLTQARIRLVLHGCETQLGSTPLNLESAGKLPIEHLMPVNWQAHWPLPAAVDPVVAVQEREKSIHTLGNLTLLTRKMVTRVSDGPWEGKLHHLAAEKPLALNRGLPPMWDQSAIMHRAMALAVAFCAEWLHPDTEIAAAVPDAVPATASVPEQEAPKLTSISGPEPTAEDLRQELQRILPEVFARYPVGMVLTAEQILPMTSVGPTSGSELRLKMETALLGTNHRGLRVEYGPPVTIEKTPVVEHREQLRTRVAPIPQAVMSARFVKKSKPAPIPAPLSRITFDEDIRLLLRLGLIKSGQRLVHHQKKLRKIHYANVRSDGAITIGRSVHKSPSGALGSQIGTSVNGWKGWTVEESGLTLAQLRHQAQRMPKTGFR